MPLDEPWLSVAQDAQCHNAPLNASARLAPEVRKATAELLLRLKGVEVAARPWLYPWAEFADTDIKERLMKLGRVQQNQKPSLKTSWTRLRESCSGCWSSLACRERQ